MEKNDAIFQASIAIYVAQIPFVRHVSDVSTTIDTAIETARLMYDKTHEEPTDER